MQDILEKMEKRDAMSKEFIESFGGFVRAYERYLKWMHNVEGIQGQYHDEDDFPEYVKKNIDLIESIKKDGVIDPILLGEDELGIDVKDGFHRLIIAKQCGRSVKFSSSQTDSDG